MLNLINKKKLKSGKKLKKKHLKENKKFIKNYLILLKYTVIKKKVKRKILILYMLIKYILVHKKALKIEKKLYQNYYVISLKIYINKKRSKEMLKIKIVPTLRET